MTSRDDPALDVIIVTHRCAGLARACLLSLAAHPLSRGPMAIHVVDNGSVDGTAELVRREFPGVQVTAMGFNAGFAAAVNVVVRKCRAPFALVLNPDTEALPHSLDRMVDAIRARPDVAIAGCRLVRPNGAFDHAAKRSFPTPLGALAHFTGIGRRTGASAPLAQYRATGLTERECGTVDAVNGAFMLVRRAALADVGLLDEGYWLYMEDLDWCRRCWDAGWRVWYEGAVTFVHHKGGSTGRYRRLRQNVAFHRGMGRFYRRFEAGRRPALDTAVYAGIAVKLLVSATRSAAARGRADLRRWAASGPSRGFASLLAAVDEADGGRLALALAKPADNADPV